MGDNRWVLLGKTTAVLAVMPALILGYAEGPPSRKTGAPGDQVCTACHLGTANSGSGKVEVAFPGGLVYAPGQTQRLTVTVAGPGARRWGFEASARLASDESKGQAGTFTPADANTQVICDGDAPLPAGGPCPSPTSVEFIEHTLGGTGNNNFSFDWTAPASGAGDVRIYVAANAANGDGTNRGDQIYTAVYTLTPAAATAPPRPVLRAEQPVLQLFGNSAGISAGTWLNLYGSNLSSTEREWRVADFNGDVGPTTLDGVSVTINGVPAFIRAIKPTQVTVQAPDDDAIGPVAVVLTNENGSTDPVIVQKAKISPALETGPDFNLDAKQYVVALHADLTTYVGRENLVAGRPFRPASPGDTILFSAVGCGPTDPPSPAGRILGEDRPLASPYEVRFGETVAQAQAFLAANEAGKCLFRVTVPEVADGDVRIDVSVDQVATGQTLYVTVQRQ